MQNYLEALNTFCRVEKDPLRCIPEAQILTFINGNAKTTIRIVAYEFESGRHLEITNMTTLPDQEKGKGYGSEAIQKLSAWAREYGFCDVVAIQVQSISESFWTKNGFGPVGNSTNDFVLKS